MERKLGATLKSQSKRQFKLVGEYAYDIPLKESLQQLLSNKAILDEVSGCAEGCVLVVFNHAQRIMHNYAGDECMVIQEMMNFW